jgi:hypothetical protein
MSPRWGSTPRFTDWLTVSRNVTLTLTAHHWPVELPRPIINGSKTAVMYVTGSLYISVGSRRACAYSEAGFNDQNGDRAWLVHYRRAAFYCAVFCGQEDSVRSIFIKKCLLFTVGGVCRVKRFTTGWQTFRWWRRRWKGDAEVAKTTVKNFCAVDFDALILLLEDMSRNKCSFPSLNITCFYVLYQFVTPPYPGSLDFRSFQITDDASSYLAIER